MTAEEILQRAHACATAGVPDPENHSLCPKVCEPCLLRLVEAALDEAREAGEQKGMLRSVEAHNAKQIRREAFKEAARACESILEALEQGYGSARDVTDAITALAGQSPPDTDPIKPTREAVMEACVRQIEMMSRDQAMRTFDRTGNRFDAEAEILREAAAAIRARIGRDYGWRQRGVEPWEMKAHPGGRWAYMTGDQMGITTLPREKPPRIIAEYNWRPVTPEGFAAPWPINPPEAQP